MVRPLAAALAMCLISIPASGVVTRAEDREKAPGDVPEPLASAFRPPAEFRDDFGSYKSPLIFDDGRPVRDAADWRERRKEILATWHGIMGAWPPLIERPKVEVLGTERRDGFEQRRVRVEVAHDRTWDGYLLVPDGEGPFPAVLVVFYEPETADRPGQAGARLRLATGQAGVRRPVAGDLARPGHPRQGVPRDPAALVPRLRRGQRLQRPGPACPRSTRSGSA